MLNPEDLRRGLPIGGLGEPLSFHLSIGSTNDLAADLARHGTPHGTLVVAEQQVSGRGRGGRSWSTPAGTALAFSLVLRPARVEPEAAWGLSLLGALGVVEAIEMEGVEPLIKWPNDVLVGGRKLAGTLVEAVWEGERLDYLVLGVGVNVRPGSVPPDERVDFPATCVEAAIGRRVERAGLLLAVIEAIARWYPQLGTAPMLAAWERKLAFRGQNVRVEDGQVELRGRLLGLTRDGRLRLASEAGAMISVGPGAASLRPIDMPGE